MSSEAKAKEASAAFVASIRSARDLAATEQMAQAILGSPILMQLVSQWVEHNFAQALRSDPGSALRTTAETNALGFRTASAFANIAAMARQLRAQIAQQVQRPGPTPLEAALAKWQPGGEAQ